ncbi:MAG: DUF4160 domain-containing protein [Clostridia bacterium]|nr:DUF4160 domain-containing protein [Clostridia bacterium]
MPILSNFYGILIKMYFQQAEHNPPHIHAIYGEYMGAIDIRTGEILEGDLPVRAHKLVKEWLNIYREDILRIWKTQEFKKIPPLK